MTNILLLKNTLFLHIILCVGLVKCRNKLPKYFPVCHRFDPNLNKCLLDATDKVRQYIARGVPELKTPPVEPFIIPEISGSETTEYFNFEMKLTNMIYHGLSKYKFARLDADIKNFILEAELTIPNVTFKSDYEMSGNILSTSSLNAKGNFSAKIGSITLKMKQKNKLIEKKGLSYLNPVNTTIQFDMKGFAIDIRGLFDAFPQLYHATNKAINENMENFLNAIKPGVEWGVANIVESLMVKHIMKDIPLDSLLPI